MTDIKLQQFGETGREMDALIAEKVMGLRLDWEFAEYQNGEPTVPTLRDKYDEIGMLPLYSTDISAAWTIVEKLCGEYGCDVVKVCKRDPDLGHGEWSCNFGRGWEAFGETAPLAICRAALFRVASI